MMHAYMVTNFSKLVGARLLNDLLSPNGVQPSNPTCHLHASRSFGCFRVAGQNGHWLITARHWLGIRWSCSSIPTPNAGSARHDGDSTHRVTKFVSIRIHRLTGPGREFSACITKHGYQPSLVDDDMRAASVPAFNFWHFQLLLHFGFGTAYKSDASMHAG